MEDGGKLAAGETCRGFGGRSGRSKWTSILVMKEARKWWQMWKNMWKSPWNWTYITAKLHLPQPTMSCMITISVYSVCILYYVHTVSLYSYHHAHVQLTLPIGLNTVKNERPIKVNFLGFRLLGEVGMLQSMQIVACLQLHVRLSFLSLLLTWNWEAWSSLS